MAFFVICALNLFTSFNAKRKLCLQGTDSAVIVPMHNCIRCKKAFFYVTSLFLPFWSF